MKPEAWAPVGNELESEGGWLWGAGTAVAGQLHGCKDTSR